MAKRDRIPGRKSLGVKHSKRNKNAKLSPFQREKKRDLLANQAPHAHHQTGGGRGAAGLRDEPVNARSLMSFLKAKEEDREARRAERDSKLQMQSMLENVTPWEDMEKSDEGSVDQDEGDINGEIKPTEASDSESVDEESEETDDDTQDNGAGTVPVESSAEDISQQRIRENTAIMNLKLSNKQLKKMMTKTERVAFFELKNKEDAEEAALSKVEGKPKSTKLGSKRVEMRRKAALLSKELKESDKIILDVMRRCGLFSDDAPNDKIQTGVELLSKKKLKAAVGKVTEMTKKAQEQGMVLNLNEELLVEGGFDIEDDNDGGDGDIMMHGATYDAATAAVLRRKEKKHLKKMVKKKNERAEKLTELTEEVDRLTSKTHIKKQRKLAKASPEERFEAELYEKQAKEKLRKDRESGEKRSRENGEEGINEDSTSNKRKIKRLSGLTTEQIKYREMLDDSGKIVEKIAFGERVEAPPVFDSLPNKDALSSINKLAATLSQQQTSAHKKNKASKKAAEAEEQVSMLPRLSGVSLGADSLYEKKRLAKLGLRSPVTETIGHSTNMGVSEKAVGRTAAIAVNQNNTNNDKIQSEFEALRQQVMGSYRQNRILAAHHRKQERLNGSSSEKGHKKVNSSTNRFGAVKSVGMEYEDDLKGSFSGFSGKGNKHISNFVVGGGDDDDENFDLHSAQNRRHSKHRDAKSSKGGVRRGKQITPLRS